MRPRRILRTSPAAPAGKWQSRSHRKQGWCEQSLRPRGNYPRMPRQFLSPLPVAAGVVQESDAAGRDVAINIVATAEKDDPVAGRVRLVVLQLVIGNDDLCSDIDMFAAQGSVGPRVGDDGDIFVA